METIKVAGFIILAEVAGAIGSIFTSPKIQTWYASLAKPSFSPPNWLFAPVWTTLFALMGIAVYLIWESYHPSRKVALRAFAVQFILNVLWSFSFFGLESPLAGLINIILLIAAIVWTMRKFWEINKSSSLLLLPYLLWVMFATVLNFSIWNLNS